MKRDGKRSWFHELDDFGDAIRALPPPKESPRSDRRAEAQSKRERKAAKHRALLARQERS